MIVLGQAPDVLKVDVTPEQDFVCTLQSVEPDGVTPKAWPVGVVISLDFGDPGTQWVAAIDAGDASLARFEVTAAGVDALIATEPAGARLVIDGFRVATGCLTVLHDGIS